MVAFPSKIDFASFLQYAPRGASPVSQASKDVVLKLKQDGFIQLSQAGATGPVRIIDYAARRVREELPQLPLPRRLLQPEVTLVPAPKSTPLCQNALWVPRRLCEALKAQGLAANVLPAS